MSYAEILHREGVVVIPCIAENRLADMRDEFNDTLAEFPEFKDMPKVKGPEKQTRGYVLGGFSALGNPASFHNLFVRELRQRAMYASIKYLWRDYFDRYCSPGDKLEQVIDRMLYRPAGVETSAESWHRDIAAEPAGIKQEVFGGWINLNSFPQAFSAVPRTHREEKKGEGFATIKNKAQKREYTRRNHLYKIPPGHMIVFFEHIVHEVLKKANQRHAIYRVFTGWRISNDTVPLVPHSRAKFLQKIKKQAVMPLKSGQTPPMYARLHWTNWRNYITEFSKNIASACKVNRTIQKWNEEVKGIVPQEMTSLEDYKMEKYDDYENYEIKIHFPRREWTLKFDDEEVKISLDHDSDWESDSEPEREYISVSDSDEEERPNPAPEVIVVSDSDSDDSLSWLIP